MRSIRFTGLALAGVLLLGACSTHQVRFQPFRDIPAEEAAELKRGEYRVSKDQLFDAAAATLEHEPFLHWSIETLDKANGFIKASAGLLREVQLRVADAGGASGAAQARSRLEVSIPRRPLKVRADIWGKAEGKDLTAYEPAEKDLEAYEQFEADAELDEAYLRSYTWRVLHDRSQVPFSLPSKDEADEAAP